MAAAGCHPIVLGAVRATLRQGHSYTEILLDRGKPNRCDTDTDTVVILRDQAEEFPLCQQLYSYQRWSLNVRYAKPKSGTKVRD